jgi:integrase
VSKTIKKDSHPHAGPMMKMALFTGLRRGELFKLQWKDIDAQRGFISIRDPKPGPDQKIPLNDAASKLLEEISNTGSPYVFPGRNGGQRTNIRNQVNRIKKEAGLPKDFRPLHGLRHVYASMLASSGEVDMYVLQKLMTHKDPKMTQRYAHLRDEALKKAAGLAGSMIEQADIDSNKERVVNLEDHKK